MAETRKDAGEARQRPRPPVTAAAAEEPAATPAARPAGIAPVFDHEAGQLTGRDGPFKGMISNPHVRNWIQGARERAEEARPDAAPGGETPGTEPQRTSVDAGPAPRPAAP